MIAGKGKYVGGASLLLMLLGAAGARLELLPPIVGFYIFLLGALAGVIAFLWGAVAFAARRNPRSLLASALGLPALIILAIGASGGGGHPINDISTDLDDPPALSAAPVYPDKFKKVVAAKYSDVQPLLVSESADAAFAAALSAAKATEGWTIERVVPEELSFEAYAKSSIFRFRDDLIVRVRPGDTGAAIDMRSRSRVGRSNLGVNAARIRSYFASLRQVLTARTSK